MTVSAEDVRWAYRLLLAREPESDDVLEGHRDFPDVVALREHFLASSEYLDNEPTKPRISGYLDAPAPRVQIDCTPAERQAMLDRIAAAWASYGETEPHWSVLVSDRFRPENIAENMELFYASGVTDIAVMLAMARRAGRDVDHAGRALDFGCGVGRLTLALAAHATATVGVDVSEGHLRLARERAGTAGIANATFERLVHVADLDRWAGANDLVVSRIVLQHNPPPIMAALLEKLLLTLAPGGTAVIQLPTYIHGQSFVVADYLATPQPQMEMNALPQHAVFDIVARTGCRVVEVREDESLGIVPGVSQTFVFARD